jgi:hypothetical protein
MTISIAIISSVTIICLTIFLTAICVKGMEKSKYWKKESKK